MRGGHRPCPSARNRRSPLSRPLLLDNGIPPNANVYAELGSTWRSLIRNPTAAAHEAKSFAKEAVTDRDIKALKVVADAVPGSVVVVSVLKSDFGNDEKERLAEFTKWGWELTHGRPRAQVLLLTGIELFADFDVQMAWKHAGAPYPGDPLLDVFHDLDTFAHATQKIHLGLDYYADLRAQHSATQKARS